MKEKQLSKEEIKDWIKSAGIVVPEMEITEKERITEFAPVLVNQAVEQFKKNRRDFANEETMLDVSADIFDEENI